jgi:RuvB C-terminal winged helix domain
VGVETAVGEERDTIAEVYEPFPMQEGFIARTSAGVSRPRGPIRISDVPALARFCERHPRLSVLRLPERARAKRAKIAQSKLGL